LESSNDMVKRPLFLDSWYRTVKQAYLVKSWELSGTAVARYYGNLVQQFGPSPQALNERSDLKDHQFYDRLFDGAELAPTLSVLDIGCGMGGLIEYLQDRDAQIHDYLGIDLLPRFVELCQIKYGKPFRFRRANFISSSFRPKQRFDVVVNMGVMVSRVLLYEQYIAYSVGKMIALANKHVLFNVITDVDRSQGNYARTKRIGHITAIPKDKLLAILDAATHNTGAHYEIREVNIYPDATDAFVRITL
jgi:2-polyprenyl-3-methyl-5-hydroxy-6-metoxy-1,4-benzoquinol methylase